MPKVALSLLVRCSMRSWERGSASSSAQVPRGLRTEDRGLGARERLGVAELALADEARRTLWFSHVHMVNMLA
jgi:hypothetical protein